MKTTRLSPGAVATLIAVAALFASSPMAQESLKKNMAPKGSLKVVCTSGAEVIVDGQRVGMCGEDGRFEREFATGKHAVKVTVFGYAPFVDEADIYEGEPTEVEVDPENLELRTWVAEDADPAPELDQRTWRLIVRTVPVSCKIECFDLGWEKQSKTRSRWIARGVRAGNFSLDLSAGDDSIYCDFQPEVGKGDLRIVAPAGIRVEVDGEDRRVVDGLVRDLAPGKRRLDLSLPGFRPARREVEVVAGEESEFACPALMPHLEVRADGEAAPKFGKGRGVLILRTAPAASRVVCERIGLDAKTATPGCKIFGVPPGRYTLKLHAGRRVVEHTIEVVAGGRVRLSVDVKAARVEALPPTAEDLVPAGLMRCAVGTAFSVTISPDGRLAAATVRHNNQGSSALLWDIATGAPFDQFPIEHNAKSLCFAPDGKSLYVMHDSEHVSVLDLRRGRVVRLLETGAGANESCAVVPATGVLWTVSYHSTARQGAIRAWDPNDGKMRADWLFDRNDARTKALSGLSGLAPDPRGDHVVVWGSERILLVLDATDGRVVHQLARHRSEIQSVAFSPDGSRMASSDHFGAVKIWDTANWRVVRTISPRLLAARAAGQDGPPPPNSSHQYTDFAWSSDGRLLAVGGLVVHLLDTQTGSIAREFAFDTHQDSNGKIHALEFSADGRTLVAGGYGAALNMWKVR